MLTLPEEFLLLRLAPASSEVARRALALEAARSPLSRPLAAARLIELVLAARVTVQSRRRRLLRSDVVVVIDATPTGDALLDEVLERLAATDERSVNSWVDRLAKGSEDLYQDRLVAKSLVQPDVRTADEAAPPVDEASVAAVRERMRAVLEHPDTADLRGVALVTLLAHTGSVLPLLEDSSMSSSGVIQLSKDARRADRLGRQAIDSYQRFAESSAGLDPDQSHRATEAAHAIKRIATAAEPEPGS